jgi:hypothetical protein
MTALLRHNDKVEKERAMSDDGREQLMTPQPALTVRVLRYNARDRVNVQGFCDLVINDILRANGSHLMRDGSIQPAKLTPLVNNRRVFIPAIEIIDENLRDSLTAVILAAIRAHLETLPAEQRVKPPRPPEPRPMDKQPQTAPFQAKPASAATFAAPVKPKPIQTKPPAAKPKLPPPIRLLASFPRTTPR